MGVDPTHVIRLFSDRNVFLRRRFTAYVRGLAVRLYAEGLSLVGSQLFSLSWGSVQAMSLLGCGSIKLEVIAIPVSRGHACCQRRYCLQHGQTVNSIY